MRYLKLTINKKLLNAASVLYAKEVEQDYSQCLIRMTRYKGTTKLANFMDSKHVDDRLEIRNNGTLPPQLKLVDLKKRHESYPRNKRIAKIFYSRGWVEKAGIGTLRMLEDCKELGVPDPKFEEYSSGFSVIFKFKEPMGTINVEKNQDETLNARQKIILPILNEAKTASTQKILDQLLMKFTEIPSKKTIVRDLNHLKSLGLIKSKGEKRGLVWVALLS